MLQTGCRNLSLALSLSRRDVIRSGGTGPARLLASQVARSPRDHSRRIRCRGDARLACILRQGKVVHLALHVGRPCPARNVGYEARRPRGGPRRVPADINLCSRHHDLRAFSASGPPASSPCDHSLRASRRRQPHDRHARAAHRPARSRGPAAVNSMKIGRTMARYWPISGVGKSAPPCPPTSRCGPRFPTRLRDSSSKATARAPAGWAGPLPVHDRSRPEQATIPGRRIPPARWTLVRPARRSPPAATVCRRPGPRARGRRRNPRPLRPLPPRLRPSGQPQGDRSVRPQS